MQTSLLIGFICVFVGIRFALRGRELKSTPRVIAGVATTVIGVAFFLLSWMYWLAVAVAGAGLIMLIASLALLGKKWSSQ